MVGYLKAEFSKGKMLTDCISYVHGIMDGEVVRDFSEGDDAYVEMEIV